MKERLIQIREHFNMNQETFGKKIGLSKPSISALENGTREITDRTIKLLCSELNINEDWFRYGDKFGKMFKDNPNDIIDELEKKYAMGDIFKKAVVAYLNAPEFTRMAIDNYLEEVFRVKNNIK